MFGEGGATATYTIKLDDAFGTVLAVPKDWVSLEWTRAENQIGALTLVLPGHWPRSFVARVDGIVEVWRQLGNGAPYLLTNTVWLRRGWKKIKRRGDSGGLETLWEIRCVDLVDLLRRRVIDYNAANTYTSKLQEADDMIKTIARENLGSLALDTTRDWSTLLNIQTDRTGAPSVRKAFARRPMLDVLQEIAAAALELGLYLAFDVVVKNQPGVIGIPFVAELRTYLYQRNVDHTFPTGNPPILVGPEFGNLDNVALDESHEMEITRGIVGGQGEEEFRPVSRFTDTGRVAQSPFGLIESFIDSQQNTDADGLLDEARSLVRRNRPRTEVTGDIRPTGGLLFDVHFTFGDLLTAQDDGDSFPVHMDRVHGRVEREGGEQISIAAKSEN